MEILKALGIIIIVVFFIFWFFFGFISGIIVGYHWNRDVESYFQLSDKASTLDKKYDYILKYAETIKDKGLNEGQARWIFKTPETDLANNYEVLQTLIQRVKEAKKLNPTSLEYQQAIRQLTDNEYAGFDSCVFADGFRRQSIFRFWFQWFVSDCQIGAIAGSTSNSQN